MEKKIEDLTNATIKLLDFILAQAEINKKQESVNEELIKTVRTLNAKVTMLEGQNHIMDVVNNIGRRGDTR
tara:strand:- start:169 stop:381 length:213 start_codon:yes stop_codon:yes gene_type:complete